MCGGFPLARAMPLLVALLLLPGSAATWRANGAFEPDTPHDVAQGWMFLEPDTDVGGRRLYFNVVPGDRNAGVDLNPNVGAVRSRYLPAGSMGMTAWLGIWKDCDRDGVVGKAEGALFAYRSETLLDDELCPPGSFHNRFGWVTELVHIRDEDGGSSQQVPRAIYDPEAAVWGDFGLPDDPASVRIACATLPFAAGSVDSTGGLLRHADCQIGQGGVRTINDVDDIVGLGLAYDDPEHPERACDHPLALHFDLYGDDACAEDDPGLLEDGSGRPMATVYDCDAEGTGSIFVSDPLGDPEPLIDTERPRTELAPTVDEEGSAYDAATHVALGCEGTMNDRGLDGGALLLSAEDGESDSRGKRSADFRFEYTMLVTSVGTTPVLLGAQGPVGAPWASTTTYRPPTYLGGTVRTRSLEPAGALWFTFYAHVGPALRATNDLPQGGFGIYGSEACGDATDGVQGGWACDPTAWHAPDDEPGAFPAPGDLYELRDTDCYDGSVAEGSGVHASLAIIAADPACPPAS